MSKSLYFILLFTFISPISHAVNPTQAYIEGDDVGQGFLVKRLNLCYFVTPLHVIKDSIFLTIKGSDNSRSLGDGQMLQPFGYDLSVGNVSGALADNCGIEFNALSAVQSDIENAKNVVVSYVNGDGLPTNSSATVQETGLVYLSIKPQDQDKAFFKGMSGSLVYSGEIAIGMLQAIDNDTGFGNVLRMDRLLETVSPFFSSSVKRTPTRPVIGQTELDDLSYDISFWNMAPIKSEMSVKLINDGDNSTFYETSINEGVAEIDLTLPEFKNVSILKLITPQGSGIKDIEILTSKKVSGKRGWISTASNTILPTQEETTIQLGNIKARRLKLKIYSSWRKDGHIQISEAIIF